MTKIAPSQNPCGVNCSNCYHNILRLSKYLDKSEAARYDIQQNEKGVEEEEYIITSDRESCPGVPGWKAASGKDAGRQLLSRISERTA